MKPVVLIGLMGCGKTTLGKLIAKKYKAPFYDTDLMIEAGESQSIAALINTKGIDHFRSREVDTLKFLLKCSHKGSLPSFYVISTGGGIVMSSQNKGLLQQLGHVYWLRPSLEIIWSRVSVRLYKRPLLANSNDPKYEIRKLYEERYPLYDSFCDTAIDIANQPIKSLLSLF
eukprot:COSAG01_NODE_14_length_41020_cov_40.702133_14_plen_172_part_00